MAYKYNPLKKSPESPLSWHCAFRSQRTPKDRNTAGAGRLEFPDKDRASRNARRWQTRISAPLAFKSNFGTRDFGEKPSQISARQRG